MKRKYKLLLTRVLAVIMALSLCGCGAAKTAASSAPAETAETAEPTAVTAEVTAAPDPTPAPETEAAPAAEASAEEAEAEAEAAPAEEAEPEETSDFTAYATSVETFTAQSIPLYVDSPERTEDIQVNFLNSIYDIPYVSMDTVADLLTKVCAGDSAADADKEENPGSEDDTDEDADSEDTEDSEASEDSEKSEDTVDGTDSGATAARVLTAEKSTDDTAADDNTDDTDAADDTAKDDADDSEPADEAGEDEDGSDSDASLISAKDDDTEEFSLTVDGSEAGVFVFQRENGSTMVVDFNSNTMTFSDIDQFIAAPGAALDLIGTVRNGDHTLFSHTCKFYKPADEITIDLNAYSIFTVYQDGSGYLPLQTIADLMISRCGLIMVYNGESVIVTSSELHDPESDEETQAQQEDANSADESNDSTGSSGTAALAMTAAKSTDDTTADDNTDADSEDADDTADEDSETTEDTEDTEDNVDDDASEKTLGDIYYAVEPTETSDELGIFTYNELCMALDYSYGLQDEHEISSFNQLFTKTGLAEELQSASSDDTFMAVQDLVNGYFADCHSSMVGRSCYSDRNTVQERSETAQENGEIVENITATRYCTEEDPWADAYEARYGNDPVGYEEVGDTAYIYFEGFMMDDTRNYYDTDLTNTIDDTIELICYANEQIHRDGSPVKNVVLDLSNNGGGDDDAAAAVIAWMLGKAQFAVEDTISGAQATWSYAFDADLDGTFDEDDYLGSDYNLYCLISPKSFSCGNMVPAALKAAGNVTLLGKASSGGACAVYNMSTADGNLFTVSAPYRFSTINNGIYYSVDNGVEPDLVISKAAHFYDREYLTEKIDALM